MDYNARFYSPSLNHFTQPDTIIPSPYNPQSWNRYSYVTNNPIKYTDPTGHRYCEGLGNCAPAPIDPPSGGGGGGDRHGGNQEGPGELPGYKNAEGIFDMMHLAHIYKYDFVFLEGDAIEKIQNDPAFRRFREKLLQEILSDPRYRNEDFLYVSSDDFAYGGKRAPGSMLMQLQDPFNPEYSATWDVGKNELTWMLRHAETTAVAEVAKDGQISTSYEVFDTLDLTPAKGRDLMYNTIAFITGTVWHGMAGASKIDVYAAWTE